MSKKCRPRSDASRSLHCLPTLFAYTDLHMTKGKPSGSLNPGSAKPGYTLHLQTVQIQWIYITNLDQVIWLAENLKKGVAS